MILIRNGLVKTMAGPDIENGQVLLDGGKIVAVGTLEELRRGKDESLETLFLELTDTEGAPMV